MPLTVFLLWDSSREEHGEGPMLVDVYATREAAQAFIDRASDPDPDPDTTFYTDDANRLDIEERTVVS